MANTLELGNGKWATGKDTVLAYNDENNNFKPLPFDFTRASSATVVNKDGLIETVGSGEPRIDFSNDAKGALLLEPQRSNAIQYSEDFTQWNANGSSIISNSAISPDGTLNADKITATTTDPAPYIYANVTATEHTFSFYYKGEANSIGKQARVLFWFIGTATGTTTSVNFTLTGDWQRFESQITPTGAGTLAFRIDFPSDVAVVGDYGYLFGAQLEQGSYATSYIPTSGQSGGVTRSADICNNGGNDQVINSTEGVLYAEISALADDGTFRMISVSDGTNDNRVRINYTATNEQIQSRVYVGGAIVSSINKSNFTDITDLTKIALSYKQNEIKFYINGELIGTDTSATMPPADTFNVLNFDGSNGSNNFYGNVKDVRVYNTALTDAELQALTQ